MIQKFAKGRWYRNKKKRHQKEKEKRKETKNSKPNNNMKFLVVEGMRRVAEKQRIIKTIWQREFWEHRKGSPYSALINHGSLHGRGDVHAGAKEETALLAGSLCKERKKMREALLRGFEERNT